MKWIFIHSVRALCLTLLESIDFLHQLPIVRDTIFIISPFWFIVELITESLDVVPVGLLVQRIGGFVCEKAKEKKRGGRKGKETIHHRVSFWSKV